jgi:hypothetical protein
MINKDVQGRFFFFNSYLWYLVVTFHLALPQKLQAVTFTETYTQVVTWKQFIQAFVKFYIWWGDLIGSIGLYNLK